MNFKFPDELILERDAQLLYAELKDVLSMADTDIALGRVSSQTSAVLRINQQHFSEVGLDVFLQEMQQSIRSSPVFDVILPTYPHDIFLLELGVWFKREIHPNSLLSLKVSRSIGGGIVVRSKNHLFDLSLRPLVVKARDKLPEVLKHV